MKKNKMSKKILVLVLCFVMLFSQSLLVMANEGTKDPSADTTIEEVVEETTDVVEEEITEVVEEETTEVVEEETTEVEEETTEVVEETTEVVEETTEVVEETTEVVEETTEVVEETTEVVEEETTEVTEEITVFNYESDIVNVVVTLTNPEDLPAGAELVVEPISLTGEQEIGIGVAANEDDIILKEIHAFDIKFMLNGEEVQPGETVKVVITLPGMDMDEDTAVYHIDEYNNIENMSGAVNEEGNVEFETPHFSTYVVVPTEDGTNNINGAADYSVLSNRASSGVLEYDKTAKVDNWDERTYDVEIYAKSILTETTTKQLISDGMLVVDMSGSMLRTLQGTKYAEGEAAQVRLGKYSAVKGNLDKNLFYYILTDGSSPSYIGFKTDAQLDSGHDKISRVMAYFNYEGTEADGWYYYNVNYTSTIPEYGTTYKADAWVKMADNSEWYVYNWEALRINTLKNMVMGYMDAVAKNSPGSYLGMTTFYSYGYKVLDFEPIASGNSIKLDVIQKFAALRPQREWCTHPDTGLEIAFKEMVSANSSYNANTYDSELKQNGKVTVGTYNADFNRTVDGKPVKKYLILFSDGEPDAASNDSVNVPKIERATRAWAKAFRDAGVTVYTVAFAYNNSDSTWLTDIASPGCTYTADTVSELESVLTQIKEQETTAVDYVTVDVKDYVDDRFVILDEDGVQITEDYPGIKNGVKITTSGKDGDTTVTRTGTVYYDKEGRQYIVWENQKAMKEGSTWTIKVQAREDYIGGNDVTTNIDGISVIDAGDYGEFDLPDPTVNVKATMTVGNNNLYIYKGTAAPTEADSPTDPVSMLYNANVAINNYLAPGYAGVDRDDFTLAWYTDAACTQAVSLDTMAATGLDAEKNYYLKFTYNPGKSTDDSDANTTKNGTTYIAGRSGDDNGANDDLVEATNVDDATKNYGIYNIKLWQIVKRDNSGSQQPLANVEFTIANDGTTYYGKSDANGFVTLYTDAAFTTKALDTPIGTFTLTETKAPEGYMISDETWTIVGSYSNNQGADVTSSTGKAVVKETPAGVVASYIYYNVAAHSLPNTGGAGTAAFTGAGAAILIGAAWLTFVMARRRKQEI